MPQRLLLNDYLRDVPGCPDDLAVALKSPNVSDDVILRFELHRDRTLRLIRAARPGRTAEDQTPELSFPVISESELLHGA